ncbi:MAG: ABC transporter ATP-binding protein [Rhodospirillaceae bacterium]|nr:ABC transporter ATP-binding protein [Rhodospirillaceae bacterium]MDD9914378.1 ABC transporter ATP-binding protein [Rhodospirillaceae bacterium]MDD9924893.1 ABC transporter ATP-binding protein [Rhodospirillaceae bacterium]
MLEVRGLETFYGDSQVLFGVDFQVAAGEVVTLMGRNGMGKTTTLNSIIGLVSPRAGQVTFQGQNLAGHPSYRIAQRGIGLVPEGRQVFPNLSVRENLVATAANHQRQATPWTLDRIYELFPALQARSGNMAAVLSGGEQQMLAIGRALMTNPSLLILDEATEGLAPLIREEIWRVIGEIKKLGIASIIVDKNVKRLVDIADRHHILVKGRIVFEGDGAALMADPDLLTRHLGV